MFALPEHRAHGRSNAFQKHQACCMPAGSPGRAIAPGIRAAAKLPVYSLGNSTQAATWWSGEKAVRKQQAERIAISEPLRGVIAVQLCGLGPQSTLLSLKIKWIHDCCTSSKECQAEDYILAGLCYLGLVTEWQTYFCADLVNTVSEEPVWAAHESSTPQQLSAVCYTRVNQVSSSFRAPLLQARSFLPLSVESRKI